MPIFSWASPKPLNIVRRLPADARIYLISDLHLGDGTRSDAFLGKDRELIEFLEKVRKEKAHLVIGGDAIDFHQAWAISRVLRAHARLFGELSRLAARSEEATDGEEPLRVIYIWGNHDYDISLFKDLFRFEVCSTLEIGDVALVQHGYEYDPFIGPNLDQTHAATRVHHLIERLLDTWIRLPLENFYTPANRLVFWLFHKLALAIDFKDTILKKLGLERFIGNAKDVIQYWSMNQIGDPGCLCEGIREALEKGPHRYIVAGHSHLPGIIEVMPGRHYVNTGSWTFSSAQYALWDGEGFTVRDHITGRVYGDAAYVPLFERRYHHLNFLAWWRENYMGWLRFRVGEEGRIPVSIR
jgi:UDP-2,3-diacylglucosamine pyrophosphatase LpxH